MSDDLPASQAAADPVRLAALEAYGILATASEPEFDRIVLLARSICGAPTALVSFVADDHQWFKARSGFAPEQTPLSQSVCVNALSSKGLFVIPDLSTDARTRNNTLVTAKSGIRFYAGAPLRNLEGQALGTLCVLDTEPRPLGLSAEQTEALTVLAAQVMTQLELRRSLIEREAEVRMLRAELAAAQAR